MMFSAKLIFALLFLCIRYGDTSSNDACTSRFGGDCVDVGTTCCRTELAPGYGLCASGDLCCLPPDSCYSYGGICIQDFEASCGFTPGYCPPGHVCCSRPKPRPPGGGEGGEPSGPRPDRPVGERPPGGGGGGGPTIPTLPPLPESVCSLVGQRVACEVLEDSDIWIASGEDLVSWGWTQTIDGSAPLTNMQETCEGLKILTSTTLCGGKRLCLHHKVPIFLKCMKILCGEGFLAFNIASDSDGPRWELMCDGLGVDASIPLGCPNDEVDKLCSDLGGSGHVFLSTQPGIPNVINCHFYR